MGIHCMTGSIAATLGPFVLGAVAGAWGLRTALWLAGTVALVRHSGLPHRPHCCQATGRRLIPDRALAHAAGSALHRKGGGALHTVRRRCSVVVRPVSQAPRHL